ncbi:MAG: glycosyltransferase family 39 protein, partial [Ferruginibacter sp.]
YFHNEFFVRLGPIILAAINTWLIFMIAKKLRDEQAGFIAALLFTASPYCSIIAGLFILPDAPQLFFWILSVLVLLNIVSASNGNSKNIYLLLFGLLTGLCILSKVHGIFLWIGFGSYLIFYQRSLLSNIYLYLAALITSIIISPILVWNIKNNFITYTFHSERITINNGFLHPDSVVKELAGGILYNNPIVFCLIISALVGLVRRRFTIPAQKKQLMLLLSLPLIVLVLLISLSRDTLPHWSGPGYIALIIITGCYVSYKTQIKNAENKRIYAFCFGAAILLLIVTITGLLFINYLPGTIGKKSEPGLGDGDFTLDIYGWRQVEKEFKKVQGADIASGATSTTFILSNKWFPGAHIDYYVAQPSHMDFIAIGELIDIHTYAWLNNYRKKIRWGDDAYFITVSNYFCDPKQQYKGLFKEVTVPVIITQMRAEKPVRNIYIYLLKNYQR